MITATIDGRPCACPDGTTILTAARGLGVEIPTLCHDDRLRPSGACRLCLVEVKGADHPAASCSTPLTDGMDVRTSSPALEATRRTLLELLAAEYPAEALAERPGAPFHQLLRKYHLTPGGPGRRRYRDELHPYLRVDMSRCITCFRCVRICDEVQGQFVWRPWQRGADTEILPHGGGTLLDSPCVSCGACADTCPTGAIEDQSLTRLGTPESWTRTTCPYCGTGCELLVGRRGSQLTQVKPVPDAPVSKGHLCVKGRYAFEFNQAADRVTEPMLRENGAWRTVSWDEAIAFVAGRLGAIVRQHGADAVGLLGSARGTNEENYVVQKFARVVLGTNNVDSCARVCHSPTAAAMSRLLGTGAATNSFDDIERAAGFLICGANPTEAHPVIGARIKQAVLRGARLVVIDPRRTELARCADVHLALRPGTNVPLLNALAHVIVEEGLVDQATARARISNLPAFREFIRAWTPERAASLCSVSPDDLRAAARLYAKARPAMAFHGLGVTEHVQGTEGVMALVNLALLTGNFGRPGSGVNPLRGQNNVQGSAHMGCEPGHLPGYVGLEQARDVFEAAWQAELPRRPGLNLLQMIDAAGRRELKALWAIGYDVAHTNPERAVTHAALQKLDLVIVQDLFLNELAARFAHVFLPAASPFEKDGTFMNAERRVQRVRQVVPPPGHARPDWQIVCEVARALGRGHAFAFPEAESIWNEIRAVWKAGAGLSYARLEHGGLQWPCPDESHPGTAFLHADSFPHGRRTALACLDYHPSAARVSGEFPFLLTTGRTLYHFNAGTMTARTPNASLAPADCVSLGTADAEGIGCRDGDTVRVSSAQGSVQVRLRVDGGMQPGEAFATFHSPEIGLNQLIGAGRDSIEMTPEYKVTAVRIEKVAVPPAADTPE